MTTPDQPSADRPSADQPLYRPEDVRWARVQRRRERIRAEIERNRAGGHRVPTWVLAAILGLMLLGWLYLVVTD